jgi:UDP-galactopyranose mutase
VVSKIGRDLYEKFFKQLHPQAVGPRPVGARRLGRRAGPGPRHRDDRYFTDEFQAMPLHGYTRMFENMLDHPNITLALNTDYRDVVRDTAFKRDDLHRARSTRSSTTASAAALPVHATSSFETHDVEVFQPAAVVNYPNEHAYTRITEFKYLTGQGTVRPASCTSTPDRRGRPVLPRAAPENAELYRRYKALADATPHVRFVGRLATYRYYNMDQVVGQALATCSTRSAARRRPAPTTCAPPERHGPPQ